MKNKNILFSFFLFTLLSCGTDDNLTPLDIETVEDSVTIAQNSEIEIFIFSNDTNIPTNGQLTLSNPSKGIATRIDFNNTANNPSDDIIVYKANPNQTGEDSFQYTVCNTSGNCKTETVNIVINSNSTVVFNLEGMPFQTLSEYQFFKGAMKDLDPEFGVIPYELNASLFTDYSKKKRFIWMPNNTNASYINENVSLDFPVGTILIKNFYYDNVLPNDRTKIIETRLMIRKNQGWIFANYIWNNEQNEAIFNLDGSTVNVQWEENGEVNTVDYRIPSGARCLTCHKIQEIPKPIGPKPRNLNLIYNYSEGAENQLVKFVNLGYLENALPNTIGTLPNYNDPNENLNSRVRAYLDINCAHCHSEETHCAYRPMRFDFISTEDFTNIGVCVDAETDLGFNLGHIVEPGDARNSVLHFRLNSIDPSIRMPLLGRTLVHKEGVQLVEDWINGLTNTCN
ncbi:MAG: hypothetical protein NWP87_00365 [Winogradskyella sp.]|nr:hypothetical protein [Winogradskyella sp.]